MSNPCIRVNNLAVGHGSEILSNLNFDVRLGEFICLMGPNGCGKTTLLRTLAGILPVKFGSIEYNGVSLAKMSANERARAISIVLTDRIQTDSLNVKELISFGRYPYLNFLGHERREDRKIVDETIGLLDLQSLADQRFGNLSDGQKQKVMIGRAVAQETPVLFLDEPTTFLDIPARMEILQLLRKISVEKNKTIIFSSHDWDLILSMSSKVWAIKSNGEIVRGVPEDLILNGEIDSFFNNDRFYFDKQSGNFREHPKRGLIINLVSREDSLRKQWFAHALKKEGFVISEHMVEKKPVLKITENDWTLSYQASTTSGCSIEELFSALYSLRVQ